MPVIHRHGGAEGKCGLRMGCGEQLSLSEALLLRIRHKGEAGKRVKALSDAKRRQGG